MCHNSGLPPPSWRRPAPRSACGACSAAAHLPGHAPLPAGARRVAIDIGARGGAGGRGRGRRRVRGCVDGSRRARGQRRRLAARHVRRRAAGAAQRGRRRRRQPQGLRRPGHTLSLGAPTAKGRPDAAARRWACSPRRGGRRLRPERAPCRARGDLSKQRSSKVWAAPGTPVRVFGVWHTEACPRQAQPCGRSRPAARSTGACSPLCGAQSSVQRARLLSFCRRTFAAATSPPLAARRAPRAPRLEARCSSVPTPWWLTSASVSAGRRAAQHAVGLTRSSQILAAPCAVCRGAAEARAL